MSAVFREIVMKPLPYLQQIDVAQHKYVCKHLSQLPRHFPGYSLADQVSPKLVQNVMHNGIHHFEVTITSGTRNMQKKAMQMKPLDFPN